MGNELKGWLVAVPALSNMLYVEAESPREAAAKAASDISDIGACEGGVYAVYSLEANHVGEMFDAGSGESFDVDESGEIVG